MKKLMTCSTTTEEKLKAVSNQNLNLNKRLCRLAQTKMHLPKEANKTNCLILAKTTISCP